MRKKAFAGSNRLASIAAIENQFVLPLMRQTNVKTMVSIARALADGGLNLVEITLMTSTAFDAISELAKDSNLAVGAGTVRNLKEAERAISAGAKFLVSPGLDEEILIFCEANDFLYLPGVLTPTEVMRASELGAEMVKVFPASSLGGPKYLESLSGPFPEMKWCATGGVGIADIKAYSKSGASAVGIGSQLAPKDAIASKNWKLITREAKKFVAAAEKR
jgi:2-dehydro-3-deoxyphosphogluconate aldolase/(4S)-4-hydroxy-2-oxoglutarate aldolase